LEGWLFALRQIFVLGLMTAQQPTTTSSEDEEDSFYDASEDVNMSLARPSANNIAHNQTTVIAITASPQVPNVTITIASPPSNGGSSAYLISPMLSEAKPNSQVELPELVQSEVVQSSPLQAPEIVSRSLASISESINVIKSPNTAGQIQLTSSPLAPSMVDMTGTYLIYEVFHVLICSSWKSSSARRQNLHQKPRYWNSDGCRTITRRLLGGEITMDQSREFAYFRTIRSVQNW
jgi:hypothetical protein